MKFGSVCSGIEAASVAWEPLGMAPAWFAEIDPFACAVLMHRYPNVPNLGDFTKIGAECEPVDLLVGGTPCQAFSVAGRRAGLDDPRGNLTLEFLALAGRLRPTWLVWENVFGVLSIDGGRTFGTFLGLLGELGYGWAYRVLDAQHFGVPQRRRRVFVVGHSGGLWQRAAAVLFERHSLSGDSAPSREEREEVAGCPGDSSGERGWAPDTDRMTFVPSGFGEYKNGVGTLRHRGGDVGLGSETLIAHSLRANGFDASEDGTGRGTPLVFDTTQVTSPLYRHTPRPDEPCRSLAAGAHPPAIAFTQNQSGDVLTGLIAPSMGTNQNATGRNTAKAVQDMAVRRLTPRECERLMGLPDGYTLVPYRGKPAADGPRYRAIGNSMAVPCMAWIGRRILEVEATR